MENEILNKVSSMYRKAKRFILCAVDNEGFPTAKAVLPSKNRKSLDEMFFVTNTASKYVAQITKNNKASVYFFNGILYRGCLLKGIMEVCDDVAVKEALWKDSYACAYPEGKTLRYDDPDFCVLKFTPKKGRYYFMFKTYNFDVK